MNFDWVMISVIRSVLSEVYLVVRSRLYYCTGKYLVLAISSINTLTSCTIKIH